MKIVKIAHKASLVVESAFKVNQDLYLTHDVVCLIKGVKLPIKAGTGVTVRAVYPDGRMEVIPDGMTDMILSFNYGGFPVISAEDVRADKPVAPAVAPVTNPALLRGSDQTGIQKQASRYKIIQPAKRLIALLENARDLSVTHKQITVAVDVIQGCKVYANTLKLPLADYFDDLSEACRGKNPQVLNNYFDQIENKIVSLCLVA